MEMSSSQRLKIFENGIYLCINIEYDAADKFHNTPPGVDMQP
jgi:hypothetical protein